ncbi:MAG: AsmA family protein [Methylovirgula sp.]
MKRSRKLVLVGAGSLVLVIVAGYFIAQPLLAHFLIKQIDARSGLHAALRSARLSLWPNLEITATGLTLAARHGASAPVLNVDEADFGISVAALIAGNVRINRLKLTHPVLRIIDHAPAKTHVTAHANGVDWFGTFDVSGPIIITDGVFIDDNQSRTVATRIEKIDLRAAAIPGGGGLAVKLAGRVDDFGLRIDGRITSLAELSAGRPTNFNGHVAMGAADATLRAVHTLLRLDSSALHFDDLRVSWTQGAQQHELTAAGLFRWDGVAPQVTAQVNADALDLGSASLTDITKTGSAGVQTFSDRDIDFRQLRAIDAAIDIDAKDLTGGGLHFGQTHFKTTLVDGIWLIALTAQNVYRGKADVRLSIDATPPMPKQTIKVNVSGLDSAAFLKDLMGTKNVGGNLSAAFDLSAQGSSPRAIVSALAGSAALQFNDGVISGVDLPELFGAVTPYLPKAWRDLNNRIAIDVLTGSFQLGHGQAGTHDLHIVSSVLDVTGKGTIDLADQRFDLRFDPKVVSNTTSSAGKPVSPLDLGAAILIRGPWDHPQITADLSGMLKNPEATVNKLQDLGRRFLGNKAQSDAIVKGLGDLLQDFGRRGSSSDN